MNVSLKRPGALLCIPLCALGLTACGTTVSTSSFQGEEREVAQTISNLQSDATAGDQAKICTRDLASAVVERLSGAQPTPGPVPASALAGCKRAIKNQLAEVDRFDLSVQSVQVSAAGARHTASARVKSIYAGKTRPSTVLLVKEGRTWKIERLG
jgi:hypothetical protein